MKFKFILRLFCFLIFCPAIVYAGKSYYIDPNVSYDGDGSFSRPWKNITSVNKHAFKTGDDLYFKVNTRCVANAQLNINWDGTATDKVIIGAYYGENKFGLNGQSRPIIDGNKNTIPAKNSTFGLINKSFGNGFVQIKDIRVNSSGRYGIRFSDTKNVTIENCYTYQPWGSGIVMALVENGVINGNIVENSNYSGSGAGASIEITGGDREGRCKNIVATNNTVFHGIEGIGIYKKAENILVANNTVYDCDSVMIYVDASKDIDIIDNIIYSSSEASKWGGPALGIHINNEEARKYCFTGPITIAGNKVAGCLNGIAVGLQMMKDDPNCRWNNVLIEDNLLVDSRNYNFIFWNWANNWSIYIKNNNSYAYSSSTRHCYNYSPQGFTWINNSFSDSISGEAGKTAGASIDLVKKSGWQSLSSGTVNLSYFNTEGSSSSASFSKPNPPSKLRFE